MKTVLLNKSGSLGQEIHLFQAPRKHLGLIKRESQRKYQCVGRATSLRHREPSQDGPISKHSHTNPTGGYPQTLRHLGDLIRQQRRKKVLQEQNGQGKTDTLTGHHQQPPGQQNRGATHGRTEGKEGSKHSQHSREANLSSSCQ